MDNIFNGSGSMSSEEDNVKDDKDVAIVREEPQITLKKQYTPKRCCGKQLNLVLFLL